jgi:hypothetical protein
MPLSARVTFLVAFVSMRFDVFPQMITAHEFFATLEARESFLTSVSTVMTLQFVRSSKRLATERPGTKKWFLSSVPPQVSFQVRSLAVDFAASRVVTIVLLLVARTKVI